MITVALIVTSGAVVVCALICRTVIAFWREQHRHFIQADELRHMHLTEEIERDRRRLGVAQ